MEHFLDVSLRDSLFFQIFSLELLAFRAGEEQVLHFQIYLSDAPLYTPIHWLYWMGFNHLDPEKRRLRTLLEQFAHLEMDKVHCLVCVHQLVRVEDAVNQSSTLKHTHTHTCNAVIQHYLKLTLCCCFVLFEV